MNGSRAVITVPCEIHLDPSTGAAKIGCDLGRLLKALGFPEVRAELGEATLGEVEVAEPGAVEGRG
jgi:hypothetical protein